MAECKTREEPKKFLQRKEKSPGDYVYTAFQNADEEIRVLHLLPTSKGAPLRGILKSVKFIDNPSYNALSYTWEGGNGEGTCIEIYQDDDPEKGSSSLSSPDAPASKGRPIQIEQYIATGLRKIQSTIGQEPIWVDAICIDQLNYREKGHQVRNMDKVYRGAKKVFIWLGEQAEESDKAMDLAIEYEETMRKGFSSGSSVIPGTGETISDVVRSSWGKDGRVFDDIWGEKLSESFYRKTENWNGHWDALSKLIDRPWFKRRWIIQEVVFGKDKLVLCGGKQVMWVVLRGTMAWLSKKISGIADKWGLFANLDWASHLAQPESERKLTLEALLSRFYRSCSSDQRDAVYFLISMANDLDLNEWFPDYDMNIRATDVFAHVFLYLVHRNESLDIICRSSPYEGHRKPSWIPQFGHTNASGFCCEFHTGYRATTLTTFGQPIMEKPTKVYHATGSSKPKIRVEGDVLHSPGLCIDTIKEVGSAAENNLKAPILPADWILMATNTNPEASYDVSTIFDLVPAKFWRSVMGNRALQTNRGEESHRPGEEKSHDVGGGKLLSRIVEMPTDWPYFMRRFKVPNKSEEELANWGGINDSINIVINGRPFATTEKSMGFVPLNTKKGDLVYLLPGCSVPVILRPCDDNFHFVGECYIDGVMEGEQMEEIDAETWLPSEIKIV